MKGTLVNAAAVVVGTGIGMLLKKGIRQELQVSVNKMLGLSVLLIGLSGVLSTMFTVAADGTLESSGSLLLFVSLAVGMLAGEFLRLEERLNSLGSWLEKRFRMEGISRGFVEASIIFCVGAMAIIGALNDGLKHDPSVLYVKSALDFTVSIILASSLGIGVIFSAAAILLYQGAITLLAGVVEPYLASGPLLDNICMVGYAIVMCIGINFMELTKIKTANTLPALFVPVVYNLLMMLKSL